MDRETLDSAANAPTDVDALVTMLTAPASMDRVTETDPLADARLRWIRDRERLLRAEGLPLETRAFGEVLGVSRQAIAKARACSQRDYLPESEPAEVHTVRASSLRHIASMAGVSPYPPAQLPFSRYSGFVTQPIAAGESTVAYACGRSPQARMATAIVSISD